MNNVSYFKVFLAVLFANLASALVIFIVSTMMWYFTGKALLDTFSGKANKIDTPHTRARIAAEQQTQFTGHSQLPMADDGVNRLLEKQQEQAAKYQRERKDRINAYKTNLEVCNFWRKDYDLNKSKYNKDMMEGACKRAAQTVAY